VGAAGAIWSTSGTGTFSPNNTDLNATYTASGSDISSGSIILYLTSTGNGSCNTVIDSMIVMISTGITVSAGTDQNVCISSDSTQLNGNISNGSTTGIWTTLGTGTFSPNDSLLSTYYLYGASDLSAGFVDLVLTSTNNGSCSAEKDTVTVNFGPTSFAYAGSDILNCETDTTVQLNGLISGGATQGQWITLGSGTFSPSNTILNPIYNITPNDIANGFADIVLITTDHGTCLEGRDTMRINIEDLAIVNAGSDIDICETVDSVLITGNVMNASGGNWYTGGTGSFSFNNDILSNYYKPSLADIADGSIMLYLSSTGSAICNSITDSIQITLVSPLTVGFNNTETCIGQPMIFNDTTVINTGTITGWQWDFGDGISSASQNPIHIFDNTGTYDISLIVTSSLGCDYQIIRTLTINTAPVAGFTINPNPAKTDENISFTDASSGATGWAWTFGDGLGTSNSQNSSYSYSSGGSYTITQIVTSIYGCTDTISNTIKIEDDSYFPPLVPTGFSPNGDGENDQLVVLGGPFIEIELKVYNNWGNLIFESDDPAIGWDGTWKGKAQPPGDYIYTVKAVTVDGEEFSSNGSVSIIK
jgi:gliding motility-associated-like protein